MRKHVVFVMDASKSMKKRDVVEKGERKCRVDAVLDACFEFIKDQLANKYSSSRDRYSVVSFNDEAKVQLRGKSMVGTDLYSLRRNLESKICPTHGTSYGAGFKGAWSVASGGVDDAGEQFVLIFLSDGRPVDMSADCKKEQPPEQWLRFLRERFGRRMTFHGVGVGPEDFGLLKELCAVAEGEFHQARLTSTAQGRRGAAKAPPARGRPETLSNTFSIISSSVSTMCSTSTRRAPKGLALEDVEEAEWNRSDQETYTCDKLQLEGSRLVVKMRDLKASIRTKPFAEGGMRYCFRMWDLGAHGRSKQRINLVGKQSKFHEGLSGQLRALQNDLNCHALARSQAASFNSLVLSFTMSPVANNATYSALTRHPLGLQIAECDVYRLEDQSEPGGFRYLLVEPFLDGKYLKYNGNNGYVGEQAGLDDEQRCWWHVAQAFSHFTHHHSRGNLLICDMQGVDQHITDPAIHSKRRLYGDGDRGEKGMRDFLDRHRCDAICRHLRLPLPSTTEGDEGDEEDVSSYTPVHGEQRASRGLSAMFGGLAVSGAHRPLVIYEEDNDY